VSNVLIWNVQNLSNCRSIDLRALILTGTMVVAGRSFFIGQLSLSAQCPAEGLHAKRQLKHLGGQEHWRMPCFPWQLKLEWSEVLWSRSPHFAHFQYVGGFRHLLVVCVRKWHCSHGCWLSLLSIESFDEDWGTGWGLFLLYIAYSWICLPVWSISRSVQIQMGYSNTWRFARSSQSNLYRVFEPVIAYLSLWLGNRIYAMRVCESRGKCWCILVGIVIVKCDKIPTHLLMNIKQCVECGVSTGTPLPIPFCQRNFVSFQLHLTWISSVCTSP